MDCHIFIATRATLFLLWYENSAVRVVDCITTKMWIMRMSPFRCRHPQFETIVSRFRTHNSLIEYRRECSRFERVNSVKICYAFMRTNNFNTKTNLVLHLVKLLSTKHLKRDNCYENIIHLLYEKINFPNYLDYSVATNHSWITITNGIYDREQAVN